MPSSKCTVSPSSRATLPLGTMSPEPSRSGSSTDWVGCASKNLWLGFGRPYSSGFEPVMNCIFWTNQRCHFSGRYGVVM